MKVVNETLLCSETKSELQRMLLGSPMGTMECWLLLRSLRTLSLRAKKQSRTAHKVAVWLEKHPRVTKVWQPSLSSHPSHDIFKKQMRGAPSTFSFELQTASEAQKLPHKLKVITDATSLGGVESLIDYR